ncbi:MAG: DUF2341 domain-containing protein [Promethearchaeota archaeon]
MRVKKYRIGFLSILLIGLISSVFLNINCIENDDFNYTHDDNREDYFSKIQLSAPSDKNWWDSSYKYRIPINITNNHVSDLPKGYSVNISINTTKLISTGKLRSDGKDLRIVWYNSTSKTWLELDRINGTNFDTVDTQIWFKTQVSINPSDDDTNYHLYYGNENADDPPTDKSKIYDFFDDFTQADGDAEGWTEDQGTQWTVVNNEYLDPEHVNDRRTILDTYTVENASIEVRIKHVGNNNFGSGIMYRYADDTHYYTSGLGYWSYDAAFAMANGGAFPSAINGVGTESNLVNNSWHYLRIDVLGDRHLIYMDNIEQLDETHSTFLNAGQIGFMTYVNDADVYFDDLKIRLLVETPPILTIGTEEVYGSWYNKDWNYHKKITITTSSANIPADYTVSLTFNHESLVNGGRSRVDGDDIRVIYWNGSDWRELDRMLDSDSSWNSSSTKIWFRTQAAIAASSFDNNYYLYYGNTLAGSPPTNSDNIFFFYDGFESGDFEAWDANSTGSAGDSISVSSDQVHTGIYAAKAQVDDVPNAQAIVWKDYTDEISIYARIHIYLDPSFSTTGHVTFMQFIDTSSGWQNLISATIRDDMTLYMWNAFYGEAYGYGATNTISTGTWHVISIQARFSETSGEARLWMDGNLEIEATMINLSSTPADRYATGYYWGDPKNETNTLYVDNSLLRLWVDPEPNLTLSTEEISRPSPNYFNYYKEITIDHTKVSGSSNLTDFPVLISILDTDLYDKVQSNGNDIAFYNGTDWLDHEIEVFNQTYSGTQAQLIAWVRIPSLSPTTDTKIYIYYGNSTMSSQENPTGVWDSNYLGVWHLSEDPTGIVYDSTTNNNDGSSYGSMNSGDQILGKIDGSINFDGNDDNIATEENNLLAGRSSFTMSAWIKPLITQSDFCGIIEYDNTTDGDSFDAAMELRSSRVEI